MKPSNISSFRDEEWKDLVLKNVSDRHKYKISNYGRIISYYYHEEGNLLKLGEVNGYKSLSIKDKNSKHLYLYVHRLVAEHFIEKPKEGQIIVMHLDYNRQNNYYRNLRWASESEKYFYQLKNKPGAKKLQPKGDRAWSKLTESEVKIIKRKLNNPKRKTKAKVLARQFGVSEMQIYRIKWGENWRSVSAD